MHNIHKYISLLFSLPLRLGLLFSFSLLFSSLLLFSCSEDEQAESGDSYGYLQVELRKSITRNMVEGSVLEHLSDAKKVKLSLKYNGKLIEQTLNLLTGDGDDADYSLSSENLKMQSGEYELLGYAIIGDYKSGDMAEILQVCEPDERMFFSVRKRELTRQPLTVEAKAYGRFSVHLSRIEALTRAAKPTYSELFSFNDIDSIQIVMRRTVGGIAYRQDCKVKAHKCATDLPGFESDSIKLQVGDYAITHFELFNKRRQFMYAQDVDIPFTVEDFQLTKTDVGVQLPENDYAIVEGIALKQIWDAMDGENWNWHEYDGNGGANWVFKMADGSPRPISAWTKQVGVTLINGRVVSLNLGSFNPRGDVPDAIGQLTALEKLYLGMHTDEIYYQLDGVGGVHYSLNPYQLSLMENRPSRMDIARERTLIRQMSAADFSLRASRLLFKGKTDAQRKFALIKNAKKETGIKLPDVSTYGQSTSDAANRITGISPEIGKCVNIQELYIANTLIKRLPTEAFQKLSNVTDLELYNNPFEEVDGDIFKNMQYLTSVNFDSFYRMSESQIHSMINKMCEYCPKIQLLYMNRMNLTSIPDRINYLTDLRLLDLSYNKIKTVKSLLPIAPIQFMMNYNLVEELPADFIRVDDLELFSMTDNRLKEFPVVLSNMDGLYTIGEINLQGNRMHGFQTGFKGVRVEQLKIGYNEMGRAKDDHSKKGEFPVEFSRYHSEINYLMIAGNNIDTIRNAAIADIRYVQALDMGVNNLTSIPGYMNTEHFPYLSGLEISHNRFRGFPNNVLNVAALQQLLCADQGYFRDEGSGEWETQWVRTMTEWPEYLHQHGSLTNVDLSGNDFREVTNFPTNLTTLNVRNNPYIRMRVPQWIIQKMNQGLFLLYYDEGQDIEAE